MHLETTEIMQAYRIIPMKDAKALNASMSSIGLPDMKLMTTSVACPIGNQSLRVSLNNAAYSSVISIPLWSKYSLKSKMLGVV